MHENIHAVFDAEPPQGIEDEIENDDDFNQNGHQVLQGEVSRELENAADNANKKDEEEDPMKGKASGINRRDSVYPFGAPSESSDDEEEDDVKERLDALERSNVRIEEMLAKLCANLDISARESKSENGNGTGTLQDLDKSGTRDLDE